MTWDDDDFDFNEELSPEEREELERELREEETRRKNHPLTKQSKEIYNIVNAIVESLPEDEREMNGGLLLESAMVIEAKLAGAMNCGSWVLSMQNAAIIRSHAEYLRLSNHSLRAMSSAENDYIDLLRREMETFRELFREWVKEFDKIPDDEPEDEWGLFRRSNG